MVSQSRRPSRDDDTLVADNGAADNALWVSEERYRMLVENAPVCIHTISLDGKLTSMNPAGLEMMGVNDETEVCGVRYLDVVVDADRHRVATLLESARRGEASLFEFTMTGHPPRTFSSSFIPVRDAAGKLVMLTGVTQDITEQKRAQHALEHESAILAATLENVDQGIAMVDEELCLVAFNKRFIELLGIAEGAFVRGVAYEQVVRYNAERGEYGAGDVDAMVADRMMLARRVEPRHYERTRPDGTVLEIRSNPIPGGGFVTTYTDVTERRRLSERLTYQATHDALTGLVNRRGFEQHLSALLGDGQLSDSAHAFCYLDLDHFKIINDTGGHAAGDELLRQLGARLGQRVRSRDTLARLGGDEFGVLLEHCELEQARQLASELVDVVTTFSFQWKNRNYRVGVSIGVVPIVAGDTLEGILTAADTACYAAKQQGGTRVQVYEADNALVSQRLGEMQWVPRIREALEHDRFCLHFQRILPLSGQGRSEHFEVLVRMHAEDERVIGPEAFLPAAERFQLTHLLDRWVISAALRTLSADPARLRGLGLVSINLSARSLVDESLVAFVMSELGAVRPEQVCFELTETAMIENLNRARGQMERLRAYGCKFALDDFGTGFASFGHLKNLPVDIVKIDGSFIVGIEHDPVDLAMVRSISDVAGLTGMKTVAEYVESDGILERLKELGIDYAQGFAVHRPEPLLVTR